MPAVTECQRLTVRREDYLFALRLRIGWRHGNLFPELAPSGSQLKTGNGRSGLRGLYAIQELAVRSPGARRLARIELEFLVWCGVLCRAVKLAATVFGHAEDMSIG